MEMRIQSTYGENIRLTIFGASHAPEIGMVLAGVPAGEAIDPDVLQQFLLRRAPGRNAYSTSRKEPDVPEFTEGLSDFVTDGTPVRAIIRNTNTRSKDYDNLKLIPRPGHADYTAAVKYDGRLDMAGGGPFSGRMTAPLCIAGGMLKQLLAREGITVIAKIHEIAGIRDGKSLEEAVREEIGAVADIPGSPEIKAFAEELAAREFPVLDEAQGEKMKQAILAAKEAGDSVGGIVECAVFGLPVGLGGPLFEGMEGKIAGIVFGIPAVKGVEFGEGFHAAALKGSENNDPFIVEEGNIRTKTNHAGGILGGISDGMPLTFRVGMKPTPSIAKPQESVDLVAGERVELVVQGRHDPCIVARAVPCVEAAAAVAVYDALLGRKRELRELEGSRTDGN